MKSSHVVPGSCGPMQRSQTRLVLNVNVSTWNMRNFIIRKTLGKKVLIYTFTDHFIRNTSPCEANHVSEVKTNQAPYVKRWVENMNIRMGEMRVLFTVVAKFWCTEQQDENRRGQRKAAKPSGADRNAAGTEDRGAEEHLDEVDRVPQRVPLLSFLSNQPWKRIWGYYQSWTGEDQKRGTWKHTVYIT